MLPTNAITKTIYIKGAGSFILDNTITPENPVTILGINFLQSAIVSDTELYAGNNLVYKNFAKDTAYMPMNYTATGTLFLVKTGNDEAVFLVNYVRGDNSLYNGLSQGDILTNLFLFLLLLGGVFGFIIKNCIIKKK